MPLPAVGLFLNAYPVSCSGSHWLTRFPLPRTDWSQARRDLERRLQSPVLRYEDAAWVIGKHSDGETMELACEAHPQLHQFLLRDAFRKQAEARDFEAWYGFG